MEIPHGGIGFFDSGAGGLTVLSACLSNTGGLPVYYYGDNARAPYGGRPEAEIRAFAEEAFRYFAALDARAAVIACNTVTAVCADFLRAESPFPVVGAEPAVRPAAQKGGEIYVLVTPATALCARFSALCARTQRQYPCARLKVVPCSGLAGEVEKRFRTGLRSPVREFLPPGAPDAVVLGCTHYVFLKEEISSFYGCPTFDGNDGISRELARVLGAPLSRPLPKDLSPAEKHSVLPSPGFSPPSSPVRAGERPPVTTDARKSAEKACFSPIFFLGSGKKRNKIIYEQMFVR